MLTAFSNCFIGLRLSALARTALPTLCPALPTLFTPPIMPSTPSPTAPESRARHPLRAATLRSDLEPNGS